MQSSTHRAETERQRQLEIRRQIKALQTQLTDLPGGNVLLSPERKRTGSVLLAPSTPSPRKKRRLGNLNQGRKLPTTGSARNPRESNGQANANGHTSVPPPVSRSTTAASIIKCPPETFEFPQTACPTMRLLMNPPTHVPERDDNLAIVEELRMGPIDHKAPPDDPPFRALRTLIPAFVFRTTRSLSHEDLQEYLRGRYYLSPSRLYSCIRLLPNKSGYDVPSDRFWSVFEIFCNMGERRLLRGDAFLSLLLFESDSFDKVKQDDGTERKIYQGGSRGAFEAMSKLKEGDVVTILEPQDIKTLSDSPHPTNNILAVTPESAGSIAIIGRARDLGMCKVTKRDGTICGSWTDKRVSEVCEWHLTNAVQRQRAGRAEFFAGTSGMSGSTVRKRKGDFDPSRQWGLKPETTPNDSTYVVSGHVVGGSAGSLFISERLGREAQAKAKRKLERNTDRELKSLLDRDKEGMKAVTKAREYAAHMTKSSKAASSGKVDKGKQKARDPLSTEEEVNTSLADVSSSSVKQAYSASIIKQLGFDPAAKGGKRADDPCLQKKIEALAAVQSSRKNIDLGPRPGPKIRSGVSVPAFMQGESRGHRRLEECSKCTTTCIQEMKHWWIWTVIFETPTTH
ncbi:hypothetical protein EV401DRAFT_2058355 [Pisolithus croceorrhizus]|nr:hypothetical protein EV401DRAFT_2058355 [Pisolithus croceorrhizus]